MNLVIRKLAMLEKILQEKENENESGSNSATNTTVPCDLKFRSNLQELLKKVPVI